MGRSYDFLVVGVIWSIAIVIHYISVVLFQPGSALHDTASKAVILKGPERADFWFEILSIYVPLIAMGGILLWAVAKEYRRQQVTARRPVR